MENSSVKQGGQHVMNPKELREGIVSRIANADSSDSSTFSTSHDMHFRLDGGVMLYPEHAISLWERMVALPAGEPMRCHIPRYGMQLKFADGRFYAAAICWKCNNISISSSGDYSWQTLDGQSEEAQSLLADIQGHIPKADPEP